MTTIAPSTRVAPASLDAVPVGAMATVSGLASAGGNGGCRRLHDLGFLPGTTVEVVRRAPLGGPVVLEVRGYQVALRRSECAKILVTAGLDESESR